MHYVNCSAILSHLFTLKPPKIPMRVGSIITLILHEKTEALAE